MKNDLGSEIKNARLGIFYSFFKHRFMVKYNHIMKTKIPVFSLLVILCSASAFAGWQNNGYYVDDGYSVTDFNSPAVTQLLEDAKN